MDGRVALRELYARVRAKEKGRLDKLVGARSTSAEFLLSHLFPEQRAMVEDTSPQVVALCTRRAGKTVAGASRIILSGFRYPGGNVLYFAPTKSMAKRLCWPEIRRLNAHYRLGLKFNSTDRTVHFPNGSTAYVFGADKVSDIERALGLACVDVIIDEAQSFRSHLNVLVEDILQPTLEDYGGSVLVTGTPGRYLTGFFYEISTGQKQGWSRHHWTVFNNPFFPRWAGNKNWKEASQAWFAKMIAQRGVSADSPIVRRNWKGEWVREIDSLVYHFSASKNEVPCLPPGFSWRHGVGVDLGVTAFVVMAWAEDHPRAYFVHAEKHQGWGLARVRARIKELASAYKTSTFIMDCGALGKHIAQDTQQVTGVPIIAADKTDKAAYQATFNDLLQIGALGVLPEARVLSQEWERLQKDPTGAELLGQDNHCADAALYIQRKCWQYHWKPKSTWGETNDPNEAWEYAMEQKLTAAKVAADELHPLLRRHMNADILESIL